MNYFDLIFVVPLLWSAYKGFSKGLIVSAASLVALLLGIYGAIRFSGFVGGLVSENINIQDNYLPLIAFAITFVGIVVGIHFAAKMISKLVKAIALGWLDTLAGIAFGLLKAAFIISIFIFIFDKIDTSNNLFSKDLKEESLLYGPIKTLAPAIFPSLDTFEMGIQIPDTSLEQFPI